MSDFSCTHKGLEESMTVGHVFDVECKGPFPVGFNVDNAAVAGLGDKYSIKLLKFELRDTTTAEMQFTSYRVGPHEFEKIQITDGQTTLEIPGLKFEVKSVLPPAEGMTEPPKPFGPFGPMVIPTPWVYWVIVVSILGIFSMLMAWSWRKRKERKEILEAVKKRTTGPTPVVQFHRDLRILTRKAGVQEHLSELAIPPREYLKELRQIGETFWGQTFNLALLNRGSDYLEPEFKSYAPKVYIKYKAELRFWNKRWEKLNATAKQANMKDFVDITFETRNLVEKMMEEER